MLIHSLFDFNLQIPSNALMFLILVAAVSQAAAIVGRRDREAARERKVEARASSLATGASL
jgi:hypothetical protein